MLGTEEKRILEAWEVRGAGRKTSQSTADWPGYRNDWIEAGNRKDRLDERLKSLLLQARDCKGTIYLRKDFQKTWKRRGWGEGKWGKWKDDGIVFSSKVGAESSGKWLLSSMNQNFRVSEENTAEYQHRKWKTKTFRNFGAFNIPKHPDFLYPMSRFTLSIAVSFTSSVHLSDAALFPSHIRWKELQDRVFPALVSGMQLLLAPWQSWGSWCVMKGNLV